MTRASATAFWLCLTIIVSLGLYHTSYRVDDLEQQVKALNKEIQKERRTIHILKAEWDFLSNPSRIESVARKHLKLQPTNPKQVTQLRKLPSYLPTRKEAYRTTQRKARHRALALSHAAAKTPRASAYETGRLNKRIRFRQTSEKKTSSLPWGHHGTYTLANTGNQP